MIDYYHPNIDLTLLGCGFLGTYHLGVVLLLQQVWPHRPYGKICGASCGGLLGALLVSGVRLERVLECAMAIIRTLRRALANPARLVSVRRLVLETLGRLLPADAHRRCSGRLGVSVTKLWSLENRFISEFESRADLIDAIAAGCFIPIWSGSVRSPTYRGERYIDGAYSDNQPRFELTSDDKSGGVRQLCVSPFAGEVQISPKDRCALGAMRVLGTRYLFNWRNLVRTHHAVYPAPIPSYLAYLAAGHRDMKEFVLASDLVKCRQCHGGRPRPSACLGCLRLLERVDSLRVPAQLEALMVD